MRLSKTVLGGFATLVTALGCGGSDSSGPPVISTLQNDDFSGGSPTFEAGFVSGDAAAARIVSVNVFVAVSPPNRNCTLRIVNPAVCGPSRAAAASPLTNPASNVGEPPEKSSFCSVEITGGPLESEPPHPSAVTSVANPAQTVLLSRIGAPQEREKPIYRSLVASGRAVTLAARRGLAASFLGHERCRVFYLPREQSNDNDGPRAGAERLRAQARVQCHRILHGQGGCRPHQLPARSRAVVSQSGGAEQFPVRYDVELGQSQCRVSRPVRRRRLSRHAPRRSHSAGRVSDVHGAWRRLDGISFRRLRIDAVRLSGELGLVPQHIPRRWLLREQHVAAHGRRAARRRSRAPGHAPSAAYVHVVAK